MNDEFKTAIFLVGKNPKFLSFYDFQKLFRIRWMRLVAIVHESVAIFLPDWILKYFVKIYIAKSASDSIGILNEVEISVFIEMELKEFPSQGVRIFPLSEYHVVLAASLREHFGFVGAKLLDVLPFRNKEWMNQMAKSGGIRVPKQISFEVEWFGLKPYSYFKKISDNVGLPFVVKPVDAAGGRGVFKITDYEAFKNLDLSAWESGSTWVVEEYIQGNLFHVDLIFYSGELISIFCGEYNAPLLDFQFQKNVGSIVLLPEFEFCKKLSEFARATFEVLPGLDGLIHAEFFYEARTDSFVFLEAAARSGGGYIIPMYEKSFGVNLLTLDFYAQFGFFDLLFKAASKRSGNRQYAAWCFIPERAGTLSHKHYPNIQSNYEMTWMYEIGDMMIQARSLGDKAASLFLWSSDYFELKYEFFNLNEVELLCVN